MKTLYTNSVRTLLVLFTFILLASSCSKKSDPDPRDQYVGTYSLTGTAKLTNNSNGVVTLLQGSNQPLVVSKGSGSDELTFTDNDTYTAKLSGSTFTVPSYTAKPQDFFGVPITFKYTASGSFSGKNITITESGVGTGAYTHLTFTTTAAGPRP